MPRPDLEALGIKYRRIPLLSIGRSVYCDTRLILEKLETMFKDKPRLSASDPYQHGIERLLESWTIDGGIFNRAGQVLPSDLPLLKDPKFVKDRQAYTGRSWDESNQKALRPEGLSHIRDAFDLLEFSLLADGREWILGSDKPTLADINAVWPFFWLKSMKTVLPDNLVSPKSHPRAFAYIDRFDGAVKAALSKQRKPTRLQSSEAIAHITSAKYPDPDGSMQIDQNDLIAETLKKGQTVASWPVDTGFQNKDVGKLVKLDKQELVLEVPGKDGRQGIRIHHPRWNFRVKPVEEARL